MTIEEYLQLKCLTYREAAALFGCSTTALHSWATGKRKPKGKSRRLIHEGSGGLITFDSFKPSREANTL